VEPDPPSLFAAAGAVFKIPLDVKAFFCKLGADLVVPAREEIDLKEEVIGSLSGKAVTEEGPFRSRFFFGTGG
jgi:hypothetical protein